jgi:hypothetical protein
MSGVLKPLAQGCPAKPHYNRARPGLDRVPIAAPIQPAGRAVVSDDGTDIRLTVYRDEEITAAVALDPARAIALAGVLITSALPRLAPR